MGKAEDEVLEEYEVENWEKWKDAGRGQPLKRVEEDVKSEERKKRSGMECEPRMAALFTRDGVGSSRRTEVRRKESAQMCTKETS